MESRLLLMAALLSLSACGQSSDNPYHASNPQQVVGDGMSVVIVHVSTEQAARPFADQYCAEHGGVAQFKQIMRYRHSRVTANSAFFDCVARSTEARQTGLSPLI